MVTEPGAQEITAAQPPAETPKVAPEEKPQAQAPESPASAADLPQPDQAEIAAITPPEDLPGPEQLMGLSSVKVEGLMGIPGFRRRDPPAELWQYSSPRCIFDIFLYQTKTSPEYRVTHLEARGRTAGSIPLRECYLSLGIRKKS
ncbi:MAG: hypothetical protein ISR44_06550 [Rhodospirillales bacterium]|nr:hypothetical protein [Rhodospirillales bacterium]